MTSESRATSERLWKRFHEGEDVGALLEALLRVLHGDIAARPAGSPHDAVAVERWVLGAAFSYVCHVAGWPMPDLPLPKRGSSGRPRTRFERELEDHMVHWALRTERGRGNRGDSGLRAVAKRFHMGTETVRKAYGRAAHRLAEDPDRFRYWDSIAPIVLGFKAPHDG